MMLLVKHAEQLAVSHISFLLNIILIFFGRPACLTTTCVCPKHKIIERKSGFGRGNGSLKLLNNAVHDVLSTHTAQMF